MNEMTYRERMMAAARCEPTDRLPYLHWWRHKQTGRAERECRNRGMGVCWLRPPYFERLHDVKVTEQKAVNAEGQTLVRRTFETPIGSVYEDETCEPGTGFWLTTRSWKGILPWQTSRRIKGPEDYEVAKFIAEHTEYVADYAPIEQAMEWLGEDGVVFDYLPHSAMQTMMIYLIGSDGGLVYFHQKDYPELVDDLFETISRTREPIYEISANSPAPISFCGDNIDGQLVVPRLFEKYFMPEYEKQAAVLHAKGKLMAVHMDGLLGCLRDQIAQTPIDIVEAFHPSPMNDLELADALAAWPDKSIWVGFPGAVHELGPQAVTNRAVELLEEIGDGYRVAIEASTENQVSDENLLVLTSVMEKAALPLSTDSIRQIRDEILEVATA
jgi:hypothetical protein